MKQELHSKNIESEKFIENLIPTQEFNSQEVDFILEEIRDINKALLVDKKSFVGRVVSFLDTTVFEF